MQEKLLYFTLTLGWPKSTNFLASLIFDLFWNYGRMVSSFWVVGRAAAVITLKGMILRDIAGGLNKGNEHVMECKLGKSHVNSLISVFQVY